LTVWIAVLRSVSEDVSAKPRSSSSPKRYIDRLCSSGIGRTSRTVGL
jgi:hypothetical protein